MAPRPFLGALEERNFRRLIRLAKAEGGSGCEAYGFKVFFPIPVRRLSM